MGSLTNFAEDALLNHLTRNSAYSPVATVYLALCTGDPGEAATGASMNECANSGNYARTAITLGAAASRRVTQSGVVTFPAANGAWGTVSHWAIVDSGTYGAGNVLAYGSLAVSKVVVSGNTPSVASGQVWVEITASTGLSNYAAEGFLNRMFRNQAFTVSANYAALTTTAPSDSAAGTEPSGNGYARKAIDVNGGTSPTWGTVSGGAVTTAHAVTFAAATGAWGTISNMMIMDALTTGNMLWYGDVADQAVGDGDTVSFPAGDIDLSQA
jgi:hypothetical protein